MSAVAVPHAYSMELQECRIVDLLVENLRGLCQLYESFTFFISAKEYRSKTDVTRIEKTNTNVACNNCQAKYDDSKCKTTDLLQVMTCTALK